MISKIFNAPPAINYGLNYGPLISAIFADFHGIQLNAEVKCLLNTHSPHFNENAADLDQLEAHVADRLKEYAMAGILWNFYRDDQHTNITSKTIDHLARIGVVTYGVFDIQRAKRDLKLEQVKFDNKEDLVEFEHYVRNIESPRDQQRILRHGFMYEGITLSQVFEQILFASSDDCEKLVVSGRNVSGAYTFQVPLVHQYFSDQPIHIKFHSLAKFNKQVSETKSRVLSLAELASISEGVGTTTAYTRYAVSKMFTNREVSQLDERDLHLARKTLIKYQNLRNVMKPSKENVQSIDIRTIFDQFRLNTLQRSRNGDTSLEGAINTAGDFFYV